SFVASLGVFVVTPLLPLFAVSLQATPLQLGLLVAAYAVGSAAGQLGAGFLADRFGSRRFVQGGIATSAGPSIGMAMGADAVFLIGGRAVTGIGQGVNQVATRVYLARIADPRRLAFFNGVLLGAASAGMVLGPVVGGMVAGMADLRAPLLLVAVISLVGW